MNKAIIKRSIRDILNYRRNKEIYDFLKAKYSGKTVFITSASIGDICFFLALIDNYYQKYHEKIVVLCDERKKDIIVSYEHKGIIVDYINVNDPFFKRIFYEFNASKIFAVKGAEDKIFNTIPWVQNGFDIEKYTLSQLSEVLKLDKNYSLKYPSVRKAKITVIEEFTKRKNRMAVVNPYYASEEKCECLSMMTEMIEWLHIHDYEVYCNAIGKQETMENCKRLECGLNELYMIADNIPIFISVRSGIVDWLVKTRSQKIVIYPRSLPKEWISLYTMKQWKVDNIVEINCWETNCEKNIDHLLKSVVLDQAGRF